MISLSKREHPIITVGTQQPCGNFGVGFFQGVHPYDSSAVALGYLPGTLRSLGEGNEADAFRSLSKSIKNHKSTLISDNHRCPQNSIITQDIFRVHHNQRE